MNSSVCSLLSSPTMNSLWMHLTYFLGSFLFLMLSISATDKSLSSGGLKSRDYCDSYSLANLKNPRQSTMSFKKSLRKAWSLRVCSSAVIMFLDSCCNELSCHSRALISLRLKKSLLLRISVTVSIVIEMKSKLWRRDSLCLNRRFRTSEKETSLLKS